MIRTFYFFLFQVVAIGMAFMPAHLGALGLRGWQISLTLAIAPMLSTAVPLAWAFAADHTRRYDRVLRVVACGAWLGFTPLLFAKRFPAVLAGYAAYAVFGVGMSALVDAIAVARVRAGAVYGRLRLWGSLGYVAAASVTGAVLGATGASMAGVGAPLAMWLALGGTFVASLRVTGAGEHAARPRAADVRALLADPRLAWLLAAGTLHWVCLSPYNIYFGILLRARGLPPLAWGLGYSIGVVAEMLVLLWFHHLRARFRIDVLLAVTFAASAARWLATATVRAPWLLLALQSLHGLSFGMFWSAAIAVVGAAVPPSLRATGQALLIVAINVGGAIGNAATGGVYDAYGPRALFLLAAAGELAPLAVVVAGRRHLRGLD